MSGPESDVCSGSKTEGDSSLNNAEILMLQPGIFLNQSFVGMLDAWLKQHGG
jgi:hypothetical protein